MPGLIVFLAWASTGLAGCVTEVEPPQRTIWEADLRGSLAHPDVMGSAATVSAVGATEASISVTGLAAGSYRWGIFQGVCDDAGNLLGPEEAYPALTAGMEGSATADALITRSMSTRGSYSAQVMRGDGTRIACGNFVEWS